jgi:hypothetical protein
MRTAVLIWSLIAALSIQGCTALHRTVVPGAVYEEPAAEGLADDELAVLSINPLDKQPIFEKLDNLHIESVDGVKIDGEIGAGTFEEKNNVIQMVLVPGLHVVGIVYRRDAGSCTSFRMEPFIGGPCLPKWHADRSHLYFLAEAKRHCQLQATYEDGRVWSWIEDEVTGEVVAGARRDHAFEAQ